MSNSSALQLLSNLVGHWYGNQGYDYFPSPHPQIQTYSETMIVTPIAPVSNGPGQTLNGVRYETFIIGKDNKPQHQEVGYYLLDIQSNTIIKSFTPPRGQATLAQGAVCKLVNLPQDYASKAMQDHLKEAEEKGKIQFTQDTETLYTSAKSADIISTPYLKKYFNTQEFAFLMQIKEIKGQLQLQYTEASSIETNMGEGEKLYYHTDSNILWKQN